MIHRRKCAKRFPPIMSPTYSANVPTTGSPMIDRVDSAAELKLRVKMAFETMKRAAVVHTSTSASTSIPPPPSLSLSTVPAPDFTSNLPAISRSIGTAATSFWQSVASNNSKISVSDHSTEYLSTDSTTTTSTSDDFFNLGCPVDMSLSYSGSMHGLEVVPLDTMMLSMSNSLAYNEPIEDAVVTVNDNHALLGCLVAMKDLTDDITLAAREVRNFYNSPRKSVTFTHYRPPACGCGVETGGLVEKEQGGRSHNSLVSWIGKV